MKPQLEDLLLDYLVNPKYNAEEAVKELISRHILQNQKQAFRTLEKWHKKGFYNYHGRITNGKLTAAGEILARKLPPRPALKTVF